MSRISVAIVLLLLAAAAVWFWIVPGWREAGETRQAIQKLEELSAELNNLAVRRDELTQQYNRIPEADLEKLEAMVPGEPSTGTALVDFETLAARHGVSLERVDFSGASPAVGGLERPGPMHYAAVPVTLNLRGSYAEFREFLPALERNLRLIGVNEFSLASGESGDLSIILKGAIYHRR